MNIPDSIKIAGHTISVEKVSAMDCTSPGEYNNFMQRIQLREDSQSPQDQQDEAFLHEIIEAIKALNNLEIDHTHLTVLSENLYQIMTCNSLSWVQEADNE